MNTDRAKFMHSFSPDTEYRTAWENMSLKIKQKPKLY